MSLKKIIRTLVAESIENNESKSFENALLDLATLDLEDDQVRYPKPGDLNHLIGAKGYDLYLNNRKQLPSKGPFEIFIEEDENNEIVGFIRGTKSDDIVSFNLIHIKEDFRGKGIGTDIYEQFLKKGFTIKSDKEITSNTYDIYSKLASYGYKTIVFEDGRVGLKK